jgi:hypothetical protein
MKQNASIILSIIVKFESSIVRNKMSVVKRTYWNGVLLHEATSQTLSRTTRQIAIASTISLSERMSLNLARCYASYLSVSYGSNLLVISMEKDVFGSSTH